MRKIKEIGFAILGLILSVFAAELTLGQAERQAVENAYEVQSQKMEEQSTEWDKRNKYASYMPSVNYSLNYMKMDGNTVERANSSFDMFIPESLRGFIENPNKMYENSFSHEISVTQPITNGGMEVFAIGIARNTKKSVELQTQSTRQDAIYSVRKAYFDAIGAREFSGVARRSLEWVRKNMESVRARHEAGTVPPTDLLQWEAEVIQKESDLKQAEAAEKLAVLTLYQYMGIAANEADVAVQLESFDRFEQWFQNGAAGMDGSIESSLELQALRSYTKIAKGFKNVAASGFLPRVNAFYTYSWTAWDKLEPYDERKGWTAGVVLNVPLFSGLRNTSSFKKADYDYKKAAVDEKKTENLLAMNLERVRLFYTSSYEGAKAAKKKNELMTKQLSIMQKRYDGGLVNQSQLLEISLAADLARISYIQKLFECLLLESEYKKTVGKLEVIQ